MSVKLKTLIFLLSFTEKKNFAGDEKWFYFKNPMQKNVWVIPKQPSTSTEKPRPLRKRQCSVLMSFSNLVIQLILSATANK